MFICDECLNEDEKGRVFFIYNYKDGKNYNGASGTSTEEITDWHIGGQCSEGVEDLISLLESS